MEIVSTVKLQKIKKNTENYKTFMEDFLKIISLIKDKEQLFHSDHEDKLGRRLLIVVTSDRWLCGSLNSKNLKHIYSKYNAYKDNVDIFCIWKKWLEYFARSGFTIVGSANLKDNFSELDLRVVFSFLTKALENEKYEKIKVYFNYFKSTINQIPVRFKIFPIDKETFERFIADTWLEWYNIAPPKNKALLIEPDLKIFKHAIVTFLAKHIIYWAVLQNKTWEHASRMIAMKNAKDNSNDLIDWLTLLYNKQRQAAVTQEISEIVSAKIAVE